MYSHKTERTNTRSSGVPSQGFPPFFCRTPRFYPLLGAVDVCCTHSPTRVQGLDGESCVGEAYASS